jgi:hypothetical protein
MKIVTVSNAYDQFLNWLYATAPGLSEWSFDEQRDAYYTTLFGHSDFYVNALRELGNEVEDFVYNNVRAQRAWREVSLTKTIVVGARRSSGGLPTAKPSWIPDVWLTNYVFRLQELRAILAQTPLRYAKPLLRPLLRRIDQQGAFLFEVFRDQVKAEEPDVLYVQGMHLFDDEKLRELRPLVGKLVGEHAATELRPSIDYRIYDLVVSSFPPTIKWLRGRGVRAELNKLAFDKRLPTLVPEVRRDVPLSFIGSIFNVHRSRLHLLQAVAAKIDELKVYGNVTIGVPKESPLSGAVLPAVWGREMYQVLRRSVATLNHHGDIAPYANNMRLYEATGMGALLITDYKDNLHEMFEPEKEVVTYRSAEECIDKSRFYLNERNSAARNAIMSAGQRRTLTDHTYESRMRRLVELIQKS